VSRDSAGLLTVKLPPQATGRLELSYEPPGLKVGLAAALLGLVGAVVLGWFGRRRRFADDVEGDDRADDETDHEAAANRPAQVETSAPAGAHVRDDAVGPS
jgi:hypothetical protein